MAFNNGTPSRKASVPAVFDLEAGLGFRLGRAHRMLRSGWEQRLADLGLSGPQAAALRAVRERPGSGLRELARRLGTDPMNLRRLADGLERAGLISSSADPGDRRRRAFAPTAAGRRVSDELAQRAWVWNRMLEELLGPSELATLEGLLGRLEGGLAGLPRARAAAAPKPAAGRRRHRPAAHPVGTLPGGHGGA